MLYDIDYQKSKLYKWENEVIESKCKSIIPYDDCQIKIDGLWLAEGWKYPPKVVPLPPQNKKHCAKGNRNNIFLPSHGTNEATLLHEIAHTASSTIDNSNEHGPDFLGIYMYLISKYMNIPYPVLIYTATKAGLTFNLTAKPWFKYENR